MTHKRLATEDELLEVIPMPRRVLKELRFRKKIPFYAPSYRIRLYDIEAVLAALDGFLVLPAPKRLRTPAERKRELAAGK
jgi:hypothetical protein